MSIVSAWVKKVTFVGSGKADGASDEFIRKNKELIIEISKKDSSKRNKFSTHFKFLKTKMVFWYKFAKSN